MFKLSSPCFSNQGVRTLLFLRCLLLAATPAVVCCFERIVHWRDAVPFKTRTVPARECYKRTRVLFCFVFLKSLPPTHLAHTSTTLRMCKGMKFTPFSIIPVDPVGAEGSPKDTAPSGQCRTEFQRSDSLRAGGFSQQDALRICRPT